MCEYQYEHYNGIEVLQNKKLLLKMDDILFAHMGALSTRL